MKKKILIILGIIIVAGLSITFHFYNKIYAKNVITSTDIFIPSNSNLEDLKAILEPHLNNSESFLWVAKQKSYANKIRAGKFHINQGMNNNELINYLRSGKAETITLTFNNQDRLDKLAGRIASQIEADSLAILNAMNDKEFLKKHELNSATAIALFLPNSYDFYWNTSAEEFCVRMAREYHRYWNEERRTLAKAQNLTPLQVSTLASIVQKETAKVSERPRVAGLYLNRLHAFWPLQADPTIIYAMKEKHGQDLVVKRVLNKDLTIDSPYNTYKNFGLPPGPIGMPDISAIEAVLKPEKHNYFYMCASITDIGAHAFATNITQHNINARKYQQWLNKQGVKR